MRDKKSISHRLNLLNKQIKNEPKIQYHNGVGGVLLVVLRVVEYDLLGGHDDVLLLPAVPPDVLLEGHGQPALQRLLRLAVLGVGGRLRRRLARQRGQLLLQLFDLYVLAVNLETI